MTCAVNDVPNVSSTHCDAVSPLLTIRLMEFSTSGLPERERARMWREELGRALLRVRIEPLANLPFHAEAELRALPEVRVINGSSSAVRFQRTRALVTDGNDFPRRKIRRQPGHSGANSG